MILIDNALIKTYRQKFMKINLMFSYTITKRKFAIHKRFDNREMYYECPGLRLNNLKLNSNYTTSNLIEEI